MALRAALRIYALTRASARHCAQPLQQRRPFTCAPSPPLVQRARAQPSPSKPITVLRPPPMPLPHKTRARRCVKELCVSGRGAVVCARHDCSVSFERAQWLAHPDNLPLALPRRNLALQAAPRHPPPMAQKSRPAPRHGCRCQHCQRAAPTSASAHLQHRQQTPPIECPARLTAPPARAPAPSSAVAPNLCVYELPLPPRLGRAQPALGPRATAPTSLGPKRNTSGAGSSSSKPAGVLWAKPLPVCPWPPRRPQTPNRHWHRDIFKSSCQWERPQKSTAPVPAPAPRGRPGGEKKFGGSCPYVRT
jgi:hypothetical protein